MRTLEEIMKLAYERYPVMATDCRQERAIKDRLRERMIEKLKQENNIGNSGILDETNNQTP